MSSGNEITFDASDRTLNLAPHPDDETIATGGVIQKAVAVGLPIRVVYLTYGDNAETSFVVYRKRPVVHGEAVQQMGLVRHDEGVAATGVLGLRGDRPRRRSPDAISVETGIQSVMHYGTVRRVHPCKQA